MTDDEIRVKVEARFSNVFIHTQFAYIDICGDLIAGILLARIIYWFMPDKQGRQKVRVIKDGRYWLAKSREEWYEEIRISPKQFDRASKILKDKGFIEKEIYKFNRDTNVHVRPIYENVSKAIEEWKKKEAAKLVNSSDFPKGQIENSPKGKSEIDERVNPLTENTTLPPTEITNLGYESGILKNAEEYNKEKEISTYNDWGTIANKTIKRKKWQWETLQQYRDYINKILPRYLNDILKRKGREDQQDFYLSLFRYFFKSYKENFGNYHPWYKEALIESIIDDMDSYFQGDSYVQEDMAPYVDEFFNKGNLDGYEMKVFSSPGILNCVYAVVNCDYGLINPYV